MSDMSMPSHGKEEDMANRTRRRLATVALAPAAALGAWAIARSAGADLALEDGRGSVGPGEVAAAALAAALGAWMAARFLERRVRRPRGWWAFLVSTALSASIIGPSWLADGTSAVALMALHVVTAVTVAAGLAGTVPACRPGECARVAGAAPRPGPGAMGT
jgi:hypothetical protein